MADNSSTVTGIYLDLNIPLEMMAAYRAGKVAISNQQYQEAIQQFSTITANVELPNTFLARTYEQRGECYWLLADNSSAQADYQHALELSEDGGQTARIIVRMGDIADATAKFAQAKELYDKGLREATIAGNVLAIGGAHRGLGILARRLGNTERSINHLTQALAAFRQLGDAREQGRALTSLGISHMARGEFQQALSALHDSRKIFESLNDRWRLVLTLNSIGECHQALYDMDVAFQYHEEAVRLGYEYSTKVIYPELHRNIGVDLVTIGRIDEGLVYLNQALKEARHLEKQEQEALILYNLATSYLQQNSLAEAEIAIGDLMALGDALDADRYRALASFSRGELLYAQGNHAEATNALQMATLAAQTALDRGILWKLHAAIAHIVDNPAIATVHTQIAADFIRQTAEPLRDKKLKSCFLNAAPVVAVLVSAGINPEELLRTEA